VVAVDLPGFGASSRGNKLYSPEAYARFLRFVTERYIKRPFYLVGHSMGGAVSMRYAATWPDDVKRLVLMDVAGILHRITFTKEMVGSMVDDKPGQPAGVIERLTGKVLEKFDGLATRMKGNLADEEWRQRALDGDPVEIAGMALLDDDFGPVIVAVRAPVLLVWGANDTVAPLRTSRVLAARLPASRLVVMPGVGHVPMEDAPARTNELLLSYLAAPASELPAPHAPLNLDPPQTERTGSCLEGSGTTEFTGEWKSIDLRHCAAVNIHDARIGHLELFESRVRIVDSVLSGDQPIGSVGSEVEMTGGAVKGRVAINADRSRLDFAGVTVTGSEAAIVAPQPSKVTLSVSEVNSPHHAGFIHSYQVVTPDKPL
jgi:pimeloyl-ACP methyl ester carboxylesterase